MKQRTMPNRMPKPQAMTLIEVLVLTTVIAVLTVLGLPYLSRYSAKSARITCANNLREIGLAYRVWFENGDKPQTQMGIQYGGWADCLSNANQGPICWTNYAIMADQLGQSPKLLICPTDERVPAKNLTNAFKDNTHLSYFVGVCANDLYPESIWGGDRNLGPGTKPDPDYGYSPKNGKGNDVIIPLTGPVSWSLKMHSAENPAGAGNILLGDGSCQQVSTSSLNRYWLTIARGCDNWPVGQTPAVPSIRLVFP
jgi:type II secretory pathway pseudopilin PulG